MTALSVLVVALTPNYDGVRNANIHTNGRYFTEAACMQTGEKVKRAHALAFHDMVFRCEMRQ